MTGVRTTSHRHAALNITRRCNQRCVFCFEGIDRAWREPSFDEIRGLLEEAANDGYDYVVFMGAEALLRRDICDVIRLCRSVGFDVDAFTNGQVLAREGFLESLVEAGLGGLQVSFHYADAETFARGTGTKPKLFERLVEGLSRVRAHNEGSPDSAVQVQVETILFQYNYKRLREIRRLVLDTVGPGLNEHRIGVSLAGMDLAATDPLLPPFDEFRDELSQALSDFDTDPTLTGPLAFAKMPLCLVPGREHLSLDVRYKFDELSGVHPVANFADKECISNLHLFSEAYRTSPYRWVCHDCELLPICPTGPAKFESPAFVPRRDLRPRPVTHTTLEQVLTLALGGVTPEPETVTAAVERWRSIPVPERDVVQALRGASTAHVADVWCGAEPALDVEIEVDGGPVVFRLAPVGQEGQVPRAMAHLLGYLDARPIRYESEDAKARGLQALMTVDLPPVDVWVQYPAQGESHSRLAQRLRNAFGDRLWAGRAAFDIGSTTWSTRELVQLADGFAWDIENGSGAAARIRFRAGSGSDGIAVDVSRPGAIARTSDPIKQSLLDRVWSALLVDDDPAHTPAETDVDGDDNGAPEVAAEPDAKARDARLPLFTGGHWRARGSSGTADVWQCDFDTPGAVRLSVAPSAARDGLGLTRVRCIETVIGDPEATRFPETLGDVRVPPDGERAWIRDTLAPAVRAGLSSPEMPPLLVGGLGNLILFRAGGADEVVGCNLESACTDDAVGFLCGRFRVVPDESLLSWPSGAAALRTIEMALQDIEARGAWPGLEPPPTTPFLDAAWRAFGRSLIPQADGGPGLKRGSVGPERIFLEFESETGASLCLSLHAAGAGERYFRSDGTIGLRYSPSDATIADPWLRRVLAFFGRRLVGSEAG